MHTFKLDIQNRDEVWCASSDKGLPQHTPRKGRREDNMAKKNGNESQEIAKTEDVNASMVEQGIEEGNFSLADFDQDAGELIEKASAKHLEYAKTHGLIGEKLIVLKSGDVARGIYMGPGPSITLFNKKQFNKETGEVGPPTVKTWRLQHASGNFMRIMGSYQVDQEMPSIPVGTPVQIIHGGQVDTGNGQRANNMLVQYPRERVASGTMKQIEASATVKA